LPDVSHVWRGLPHEPVKCGLPSDVTYYVCTIPSYKDDRVFHLYTDLYLIWVLYLTDTWVASVQKAWFFLMLKLKSMLSNHQKVLNQFSKVPTQNIMLTSSPGM
jgi:hypothetical protein